MTIDTNHKSWKTFLIVLLPLWFTLGATASEQSEDRVQQQSDPAQLNSEAEDPCLGEWQGFGRNDGSKPWSIAMTITTTASPGRCGTIEYPSLGCGGFLENCRVVDGWLVFEERYTHNPGTCAPAGRIKARCTKKGEMRWRWFGMGKVETTLQRKLSVPKPSKVKGVSP